MSGKRTEIGGLIRVLCGVLGGVGVLAIGYGLVVDLGSELTWVDAVKYLAMGFACYLFLSVAIRGVSPSWIDI